MNNAFVVADKKNNFIKNILIDIIDYEHPKNYKDYCSFNPRHTKVLKHTGPLRITETYINYKYKSFIKILTNNYFYGISYDKKMNPNEIYFYGISYDKKMNPNEIINYGLSASKEIKNCYFLHLHESSWWKEGEHSIFPHKNPKHNLNNLEYKKIQAKLDLER